MEKKPNQAPDVEAAAPAAAEVSPAEEQIKKLEGDRKSVV